ERGEPAGAAAHATDEASVVEPAATRALPTDGTAPPPHLSEADLERLQQRVQERFGAFGERAPTESADEGRSSARVDWRPDAKLMAGVAVASAFLSFVSQPAFDRPGAWASSFRLDTVFVI